MWKHFEDGAILSCGVVCGKKRSRRSNGDTGWWNEEVKETSRKIKELSREKDAHKALCRNSTEENKNRNEGIKSTAKNVV